MVNINNKNWYELKSSDIKKLLSSADDETFFFEFKSDDVTPAKLAKEVSAFSNTYGGYILLGINDDKTVCGCTKWTEERINTTIYDSITPVPNFDVKKFKVNKTTVLAVKIEEGAMPPYITNKGQIFERVSSGSYPINDSGKLSQLYTKRQDQLIRTKSKIELSEIRLDSSCPNNLCGYLDLGFSVTCSENTTFQETFSEFDFSPISEFLKSIMPNNNFSISYLGHSVLISVGRISATTSNNDDTLINAGVNNFLEIMHDGSVRSRIVLAASPDFPAAKVDISHISSLNYIFRYVYMKIFENDLYKKFVYAQKYEHLTVIKQFVPYYGSQIRYRDLETSVFNEYLTNHKNKYGNNLMIVSNRLPKNDYFIIDKRWFNTFGLKYNKNSLIRELFLSEYLNLGYIDPLKKL